MYVVIMAGGSGTRFWPVSRKANPNSFWISRARDPWCSRPATGWRLPSKTSRSSSFLSGTHGRGNGPFQGQKGSSPGRACGKKYGPLYGARRNLRVLSREHRSCGVPPCGPLCVEPRRSAGKRSSCHRDRRFRPDRDARHCSYETRDRLWVHSVVRGAAGLLGAEGLQGESLCGKAYSRQGKAVSRQGDYLWNSGIFVATLKPS